ncbi:BlaI/MecI/CopY family transcriptional regulator [Sandaracinobacter sp.]|jgi:predicted transcriptional regulator|uniref:BlaI/MecI/CopY family transcriptional regulator n=1 Tax=Sandaracinobacter sp. TaxID=2487581 RepID=UPI0035B44F3E
MIPALPRREREIFEILCGIEHATAAEVRERLADAPGYSAVRTLLARLEARGLVRHRETDAAYVYEIVPREADVRASALRQMVRTLFDGSAVSAATALLGLPGAISDEELDRLQQAIDAAREVQP